MKKLGIVAVLLAAGAFAASGLFAQITFNGYVNSGLGVVYSSEEGAPDPYIAVMGTDSEQAAFRVRLNGSYTNEAGNAGVNLRLHASAGVNAVAMPFAYGWFSAFDKLLTVKGGLVDDGTWNTMGRMDGDVDEGLGALARVTPIPGLDIGVGAYVQSLSSDGATMPGNNTNYLTDPNVDFDASYYARELAQAKYTFGLGYTLPDLVKIAASYRPESQVAGSSRLRAGVSLLAVPNLKAVLELQLDNLQDFSDTGLIDIYETVQYDNIIPNLSVGLWAIEYLNQASDTDLGLYVGPWVSYALGSIVPRLDFVYGNGVKAGFNSTNSKNEVMAKWHRKNYSAVYDSDVSVISIRPSVTFNIDSKTFVEIGDLIDIDGAKDGWGDDDSRISNVFYVDFKWSF
jgi:hypothetical protein